jgi:hypothetical protein
MSMRFGTPSNSLEHQRPLHCIFQATSLCTPMSASQNLQLGGNSRMHLRMLYDRKEIHQSQYPQPTCSSRDICRILAHHTNHGTRQPTHHQLYSCSLACTSGPNMSRCLILRTRGCSSGGVCPRMRIGFRQHSSLPHHMHPESTQKQLAPRMLIADLDTHLEHAPSNQECLEPPASW